MRAWWAYVPGACWTAPEGPGSSTRGRHRHPVTHVAYEDALAYAQWAGKDLPTEAEWEYAARGGLDGKRFAWGDEITVGGRMMANWWQGQFPWQNTLEDGYERTSPVGAFAPNGYGLYDVCGNVWEWTKDRFEDPRQSHQCCGPDHPLERSGRDRAPRDPGRIAPMRTELLPPVPPRRPTVRNRRHIDQPHRLSLRHPDMRSVGWRGAVRRPRTCSAGPCRRRLSSRSRRTDGGAGRRDDAQPTVRRLARGGVGDRRDRLAGGLVLPRVGFPAPAGAVQAPSARARL